MKKQTLLKAFRFLTLLCLLCLGTNAWGGTATTVTYTVTGKSTLSTTGTAPTGSSAAYTQTYSTAKQATSGNSMTLTLKGYVGNKITGITMSMHSNSSKGAGTLAITAGKTSLGGISTATNFNKWYNNTSFGSAFRDVIVELTNSTYGIQKDEDVVINIGCTTNSLYCESFAITYEADGGEVYATAPSLTAGGAFTETQEITITNNETGGTVYYTTDGSDPTTSSASFTEESKTLNIATTTTVKAMAAAKDKENSSIVSATYAIHIYNSLEELVAADITSGTTVKVTFENQPIKDFYIYGGNRNGIYFDIQKEDNDIEIYYNGVPTTWVVGGLVSGTMTCPWKKYGSTWELAPAKDSWSWENLTYTDRTLESIAVSGTPTKTVYENGDEFNPEGLVVTGTYNIGEPEVITEGISWTFNPTTLTAGETSCTVTATVDEISSEGYVVTGLTVNAPRVLTSVVVSGTPTKNVYTVGDTFEPAGLTVTANYSSGDPVDVTDEAEFSYSTEPLTFGTSSIDVTATYDETTSVAYACPITVNKKEAAITIADLGIGIGATVTVSATTTPEEAELTYSITSGSEFITLNGDEITGVAAGTAVVNAHFDGNEEYAAADKSFNVVVSNVTKDKLVASMFAATSTTYTDFSDVTATSSAVYAGNNGKTSKGGIQLRSKNSSGIVSTTSGGFVKQVSIVVESGSNTVDVYGKNTPYESASDLYSSSTQGTKVGSLSATGVIDVTGDYAYIGIRSNNNALYLTSIEIAWEAPKAHTITVSSACETEGTEGLTTMFVDYATEIPADCKAYYVSAANEGALTLTKCDKYVAANQGVLVWGAKGDSFTFTQTGVTVEAPATNLLIGAVEDGTQVCSEGDGIYYLSTTGSFKELDGRVMKANKAYLNLGTPGIKEFTFVIDGETSINNVDADVDADNVIYNLAGQKINKLQKGINIVNGKKVLF